MFNSSPSQPVSQNNHYILLILLLYHPPQDLLPLLTPLIYSCLSSASFLNGSTASNLLLFNYIFYLAARVQFSSVAQSCLTLCDPMNCSTPGLCVHHQLPDFTQTHVRVGDAIQPSHPLSSPFPPAPNPSQHQSLF